MIGNFVLYDPATGRIDQFLRVQRALATSHVVDGLALLELPAGAVQPDEKRFYVAGGELREREALPVTWDRLSVRADGVDRLTLTVPPGTVAAVDDARVIVADGVLTWGTEVAGLHVVALSCWPWRDAEIPVHGEPL